MWARWVVLASLATAQQTGDAMRKLFILNVLIFALVTVATGTLLATTLSSSANVALASAEAGR
jgi:hypothetical protein